MEDQRLNRNLVDWYSLFPVFCSTGNPKQSSCRRRTPPAQGDETLLDRLFYMEICFPLGIEGRADLGFLAGATTRRLLENPLDAGRMLIEQQFARSHTFIAAWGRASRLQRARAADSSWNTSPDYSSREPRIHHGTRLPITARAKPWVSMSFLLMSWRGILGGHRGLLAPHDITGYITGHMRRVP